MMQMIVPNSIYHLLRLYQTAFRIHIYSQFYYTVVYLFADSEKNKLMNLYALPFL